LAWSQPDRLQQQASGDAAIGLLLGPALRFAMERIWQNDKPGRPESWDLLVAITSAVKVDPVVASIALRTVAERCAVGRAVANSGGVIRSGSTLHRVALR
jgi:hypothetical protein